jgi:hypothetical protein
MSVPDPRRVDRTAKRFFDTDEARSFEEADEMSRRLILQVSVGPTVTHSRTQLAALLTVVNAGHRAFRGGVRVLADDTACLEHGWGVGRGLHEAIKHFGGEVVTDLDVDHPTVCIGEASRARGRVVLFPTWHGWCAGVVERSERRLDDHGMELAGVAAGALAVSEAFQLVTGAIGLGRREVGLSLWLPGSDWRDGVNTGLPIACLPAKVWSLGLGHLGQAYMWNLGFLPYANPADLDIGLVDFDEIEEGNHATGMLTAPGDCGLRKTKVVAQMLESVGITPRVVDRRFDLNFWPQDGEPTVALGGFDKPQPRTLLGGGRFSRVIDGGLSTGSDGYLSMIVYSFPSTVEPAREFSDVAEHRSGPPGALGENYEREVRRLVDDGIASDEARCGMTMVAEVAVAAAFVGCVAGALVLADLLRFIHGGADVSVLRCDLRSPSDVTSSLNTQPGPDHNPGIAPCLPALDADTFVA